LFVTVDNFTYLCSNKIQMIMHNTIFNTLYAASDFTILEYNTYATAVQYPIVCYCEFDNIGDKTAKEFFESILAKAQVLFGDSEEGRRDLMENKISFRIRHKNTGSVYYVGYKDGYYKIGLAVNDLGCRTYSFEKNKWIS